MKLSSNPFIHSVLNASLLCSSIAFGTGLPAHASRTMAVPPTYDGQTVFKGILFGDGPVANALPEIWASTQLASAKEQRDHTLTKGQIESQEKEVLDRLATNDPTFFNRFGAAMQSGDRVRMRTMLQESGTRLKALNGTVNHQEVAGTWLIVDQYVALWVAVAIAAMAVLVIEVALPVDGEVDAGLQQDMLIDLTARRLYVPSKA